MAYTGFYCLFIGLCLFILLSKRKTMAIEHNITNQYLFASELEDIVITGVATSSLSFYVSLGEDIIFSTSYVPNKDGVVQIYDISSLLLT